MSIIDLWFTLRIRQKCHDCLTPIPYKSPSCHLKSCKFILHCDMKSAESCSIVITYNIIFNGWSIIKKKKNEYLMEELIIYICFLFSGKNSRKDKIVVIVLSYSCLYLYEFDQWFSTIITMWHTLSPIKFLSSPYIILYLYETL